jgi:hypothetical protein
MKRDAKDRSTRALQTFCSEAARQMNGLETRLRTIMAVADPEPGLELVAETVRSSFEIAKLLLDAGQRGHHGTLLAHRPLLRALSATRR